MANQQFRKVKSIDTQNSVYLNFCSKRASERRTLKNKLPPTAINQLSLLFEDVTRNLLSEYFTLTDKRILAFEERCNQFGYIQKYREIDVVGVQRSQPYLLFEVKTSSSINQEKVIHKAKKQLRKSQEIASWLNPELKLCIIYIDIYSHKIIRPRSLHSFDTSFSKDLNSIQTNTSEEIPCIILSGAEIWYQAVSRGWIENSCLWTEAQAEIEENMDKQNRKKASIAEGAPAEILQFGEFNGETSFQQAFLKARQKQKRQHLIARS